MMEPLRHMSSFVLLSCLNAYTYSFLSRILYCVLISLLHSSEFFSLLLFEIIKLCIPRSKISATGYYRSPRERPGKQFENFRLEYCFHVPLISGIFLREPTRIFRSGLYALPLSWRLLEMCSLENFTLERVFLENNDTDNFEKPWMDSDSSTSKSFDQTCNTCLFS